MQNGCLVSFVKPLVELRTFPLNENAIRCFYQLKNKLADATLASVDKKTPFTLETDASNVVVSAVLHQNGRLVTFWSRTLNSNEKRCASVEKETAAIVEASAMVALFIASQIYHNNRSKFCGFYVR